MNASDLKTTIISKLLGALLGLLGPDTLRRFADMAITTLEQKVTESPNTIDDTVVLPLIHALRTAFNLPEDGEEPPQNVQG